MAHMHLKIPHRLPNQEQALRKMRTIVTGFKAAYADQIVMEHEKWSVRGCRFAVLVGRRRIVGDLNVHSSYVELVCDGNLPRLAQPRLEHAIRSQLGRFLA